MLRTRTKGDGFAKARTAVTIDQVAFSISKNDISLFSRKGKPTRGSYQIGFKAPGDTRPHTIATRIFSADRSDYYRYGPYYYWAEGAEKRLRDKFVAMCNELVAEANGYVEANHEDTMVQLPSEYHFEICRDVVTPNFKKLVKRGAIINSPFSSEKVKGTFGAVGANLGALNVTKEPTLTCRTPLEQRYPSGLRTSMQFKAEWERADSTIDPDDFQLIVENMRESRLTSQNQIAVNTAFGNKTDADFDLSVFIAESQSTISFVANRMRTLASIVHSLKSGQWAKLAPMAWKKFSKNGSLTKLSIADGLADAWLEMRYAWCPLIMDVNGVIKTLKKGELTPRQTFRGYAADSFEETLRFNLPSGATFSGNLVENRSSRAGVMTSVDVHAALSDRWGLMTWANTAWELVPFSFVIDWFIDIGALLKASTSFVYKDLAVYVTDKSMLTFSGEIDTGSSKIPVHVVREMTDRTPGGQPQYASFNINLNLMRLTDAAALLLKLR